MPSHPHRIRFKSKLNTLRIAGLETDTHLKGNQFNVALTSEYAVHFPVSSPLNLCSILYLVSVLGRSLVPILFIRMQSSYVLLELRRSHHCVYQARLTISLSASNLVLKKIGANRWLPILVIAWGTVTTYAIKLLHIAPLTQLVQFIGFDREFRRIYRQSCVPWCL